ncbi:MAG: hypothetical protein QMC27_00390, partial [Flavobacteriaceae bacterium]
MKKTHGYTKQFADAACMSYINFLADSELPFFEDCSDSAYPHPTDGWDVATLGEVITPLARQRPPVPRLFDRMYNYCVCPGPQTAQLQNN